MSMLERRHTSFCWLARLPCPENVAQAWRDQPRAENELDEPFPTRVVREIPDDFLWLARKQKPNQTQEDAVRSAYENRTIRILRFRWRWPIEFRRQLRQSLVALPTGFGTHLIVAQIYEDGQCIFNGNLESLRQALDLDEALSPREATPTGGNAEGLAS